MEPDVASIAGHFNTRGAPVDVAGVARGHINDTYILTAQEGEIRTRYVLQRINHHVFKDPPGMMANITRITEHIRLKVTRADPPLARRQLTVIETDGGSGYHQDIEGNFWRVYNFIEDALTYDTLQSPARAGEAARMFGWFQRMLLDLPGPPLHDTIPDFHNTRRRVEIFRDVLKGDAHNRARHARAEVDFLLENTEISDVVGRLVACGEVREVVCSSQGGEKDQNGHQQCKPETRSQVAYRGVLRASRR